MTNIKETTKILLKNWEQISLELHKLKQESQSLAMRKEELLSQLNGLLKTFDILGDRPKDLIIPPEIEFKASASIGDTMEAILLQERPLSKGELIRRLQKAGRLDTKNARIILANAIKRDTKKRFEIVEDGGWVTLRGK